MLRNQMNLEVHHKISEQTMAGADADAQPDHAVHKVSSLASSELVRTVHRADKSLDVEHYQV